MRTLIFGLVGMAIGGCIGLHIERKDEERDLPEDEWLTPQTASQSLSEPYTDVEDPELDRIVESDGIQANVVDYPGIWNGREVVVTQTGLQEMGIEAVAPVEETWMDELDTDNNYREVQTLLATVPSEELETLRANQSPRQAWNQYVAMKLSDLNDGWIFKAMFELFRVEYHVARPDMQPARDMMLGQQVDTKKDAIVFDHLLEAREEFFGTNFLDEEPVTIAELILYFAGLMNFDFGGEIEDYVEEMLNNLLIDDEISMDELLKTGEKLENHVPIGRETDDLAGLFAVPDWIKKGTVTSFLDQYYQYHGFTG